ncbi:MAG: peptide chain release factor 2 [Candidatus Spechtbacterales bacterium]
MKEIKENLEQLRNKILEVEERLDFSRLKAEIEGLKAEAREPGFWDNPEHAAEASKKLADLEEEVGFWEDMKSEVEELEQLASISEHDSDIKKEITQRTQELEKKYTKEEFRIFLSGPYDKSDAFITIYAGAGGLDAQDWAEMLLRMYQRYLENSGYTATLHDESRGEEKGIKEATLEARGKYAYGFLKYENGVHRLVRISPYSSQKLRHTSFALVEVVPKLQKLEEFEIPESDLRIDTFRSSGPGGQYVNKRDSAVRVTHIPTGITASSQSERLQGLNKDRALEMLRSKLFVVKQKERKKELKELKGDNISAEWGNQIRSYVLHPYQMVKDHRTDVETSNVDSVLGGNLSDFIDEEVKKLRE